MANFNRFSAEGVICRDIDFRQIAGKSVAKFTLACGRRYKAKDGQFKDDNCFVDCEAWEYCADKLAKAGARGVPVLLDGRLSTDTWTDKNGQKRSALKCRVENIQILPKREYQQGGQVQGQGQTFQAQEQTRPTGVDDADIPF